MSAATRLVRSFGSGNQKKWTMSFWMKVSRINYTDGGGGNSRQVFGQTLSNYCRFIITGSTQKVQFYESQGMDLRPSMTFNDCNAWYHVVVAVDTAQATAANRVKIYVNGVQQTAFDTETYPAQNADLHFNKSGTHDIGGSSAYGGYDYFNGLLSHVHLTDGYAYAASDFGSTDSTTGEWSIKTAPSVSYGTTGYWILKDGNGLTDQSPNSNDWTLSTGTLTKSEDNPSNVFATLNPLSNSSGTFSNGNNSISGGNDTASTLGVSTGKWYWEVKRTNTSTVFHAGICSSNQGFNGTAQQFLNGSANSVGGSIFIRNDGTSGSTTQASNAGFSSVSYNLNSFTVSNGDILGFALDLDSGTKRLDIYKNGSSVGYVTFSYDELNPIFVFCRMNSGATSAWNFGNGYFGTTAVSSAGTNASNLGIFEYDVPANYTALCTKGLNE